jgi:hypothetical protein
MSYASESVNSMVEGVSSSSAVQRSNAGFKSPGQTAFVYTGSFFSLVASGASYTSTLLGTLATTNPTTGVAANVYITDFQLTSNAASGNNLDAQVQVGGATLLRTSVHSLAPADFINMETQPNAVAGGKSINILLSSVASITQNWYFLSGWSE